MLHNKQVSIINNWIVALSNFLVFIFSPQLTKQDFCLILFPATASFLFHLSETDHGLPGVKPFSKYTTLLYWIDIFAVIFSGTIMFASFPNIEDKEMFIIKFLFGLLFLAISEIHLIFQFFWKKSVIADTGLYVWAHSIWHITAFVCYQKALDTLN